jgi:hypothetical protein
MGSVEKTVAYMDGPGEENTETVLKLVKKRAEELGIKDILVASTYGNTGVKASEALKGFNVVVVTHCTGFSEPGAQQLTEASRKAIETNGAKILTGMHAFMNVERAIRSKFDTAYPAEIIAETLRLFGQGMKVAVEIVAMAADAGMIPANMDVISVAGTGKGADTAIVVTPANSHRLFDMTVKEIIAKPRRR